jgi:hypothetical protein
MGVEDLTNLNVEAGVNAFDGQPYCHIEARGADNVILMGQLPPAEIRQMALRWLSAADAAEHDAATFAFLQEAFSFTIEQATSALQAIRKARLGNGSSEA